MYHNMIATWTVSRSKSRGERRLQALLNAKPFTGCLCTGAHQYSNIDLRVSLGMMLKNWRSVESWYQVMASRDESEPAYSTMCSELPYSHDRDARVDGYWFMLTRVSAGSSCLSVAGSPEKLVGFRLISCCDSPMVMLAAKLIC